MKALLSQEGVEVEERDFFKEPFSETELRGLLGDDSPGDIFSWRSPSVKKLGLDRDALSDDDLIRLMVEEPRLVRRPLLDDGRLVVGVKNAAELGGWLGTPLVEAQFDRVRYHFR